MNLGFEFDPGGIDLSFVSFLMECFSEDHNGILKVIRKKIAKKSMELIEYIGEDENYTQAIEDLDSCLEKCKEKLSNNHRQTVKLVCQLKVALVYHGQFDPGGASLLIENPSVGYDKKPKLEFAMHIVVYHVQVDPGGTSDNLKPTGIREWNNCKERLVEALTVIQVSKGSSRLSFDSRSYLSLEPDKMSPDKQDHAVIVYKQVLGGMSLGVYTFKRKR